MCCGGNRFSDGEREREGAWSSPLVLWPSKGKGNGELGDRAWQCGKYGRGHGHFVRQCMHCQIEAVALAPLRERSAGVPVFGPPELLSSRAANLWVRGKGFAEENRRAWD